MKISIIKDKAIDKAKSKIASYKERRESKSDVVDYLGIAREANTETDPIKRLTNKKIMTSKAFWGDKNRAIDLFATWGHMRYHSVSNFIVGQMVQQPIRAVKILLCTTTALAILSVSAIYVSRLTDSIISNTKEVERANVSVETAADENAKILTNTIKTSIQAGIIKGYGIDFTKAISLSEGKKAHAKWGFLARELNSKTGQVDFDKLSVAAKNAAYLNTNPNAVDLSKFSLNTRIWREQLITASEDGADTPKELKIAAADGFWLIPDVVTLLDENGVLVSSEGKSDKVVAAYKNGQLSINVLDNGQCWHVFGTPLNSSCVETDLTDTNLEFNANTLTRMFDVKNYQTKNSSLVEETEKVASQPKWYLDIPNVSKIETSYDLNDIDYALDFMLKSSNSKGWDLSVWKEAADFDPMPLKTAANGFFNNLNVLQQLAKTPVAVADPDGRGVLVAGVVEGNLEVRLREDNYCFVIFGTATTNCDYASLDEREAFLKSLFDNSGKSDLEDIAFYTKANLKGEARYNKLDDYYKVLFAVKQNFGEHLLDTKEWPILKQNRANIVRRKADGILFEDNSELIKNNHVVAIADPENDKMIGIMSNISGDLQLDVFKLNNGTVDCYNIFGVATNACKSENIINDIELQKFIKSMF